MLVLFANIPSAIVMFVFAVKTIAFGLSCWFIAVIK